MISSDYEEDTIRIIEQLDLKNVNTKQGIFQAIEDKWGHGAFNTKLLKIISKSSYLDRVLGRQKIFTKAGGIDLKADKRKQARVIVTSPTEFIKKGAKHSDLAGLDTRKKFGYTKSGLKLIDPDKTKVVNLKPSYTYARLGKFIKVKRKELRRIYVYNKNGKRLGLKKTNKKSKGRYNRNR